MDGSQGSDVQPGLAPVVESIYRAVLEPEGWREPLDRLAAAMGACSASVVAVDMRNQETLIGGCSSHLAAIAEVVDHWHQNYARYEESGYRRLFASPALGFRSSVELIGVSCEEDQMANPSVAFGREHMGFFNRAASRLCTHGAWMDVLAVHFSPERGGITSREAAAGAPLIPHFAQAVEMARAFRLLRARYRAVIGALDHLRMGFAILLRDGEVVVGNVAARAIIDARDGLGRDPRGRLRAHLPEDSRALERAIRRAAETAHGQGSTSRTLLSVRRRSGRTSYLAAVVPLADDGNELDPNFRGAVVTIIDPDDRFMVSTTGLRQLYGLTPAEAEIAAMLAQGFQASTIAAERGTTRDTVRTQIKTLFQKTKVSSRAELVRLAVMVDLPIGDLGPYVNRR